MTTTKQRARSTSQGRARRTAPPVSAASQQETREASTRNLRAASSVQTFAIEQVNQRLQQLPPKNKHVFSMREAIAVMQGSILAVLEKGYSREEVAEILNQFGIPISATSLKYYLAALAKQSLPNSGAAVRLQTTPAQPVGISPAPTVDVLPKRTRKTRVEDVISYLLDDSDLPLLASSDSTLDFSAASAAQQADLSPLASGSSARMQSGTAKKTPPR